MNFDGIERVDVNSLGGNDVVTVDDLAATKVRTVNHDEALGGAMPDRAPTRRSSTRRTQRRHRGGRSAGSAAVTAGGYRERRRRRAARDALTINASAATTAWTRARWAPTRSKLTQEAVPATTRCRRPRQRSRSSAATATTRSTATRAMTRRSWAPAPIASPGIRATAATPSRARRPRRDGLQRRQGRRGLRRVGQRRTRALLRNVANITMDLDDVEGIESTRWAAPTA